MAAGPKVNRYLLASEQRVFAVRRHWASLASAFTLFIGFILLGLIVLWVFRHAAFGMTVAVFFLIFSALWMLWQIGDWYFEEIVVTNRRVLLVRGIVTKKVGIMPLIKVTDLTFEQSFFGRLLGYGTFIVESAGQDQALSRIDYLARPLLRYRQVSALLFGTDMDRDPEDVGDLADDRHVTAPIPRIPPRRSRARRRRWRRPPGA